MASRRVSSQCVAVGALCLAAIGTIVPAAASADDAPQVSAADKEQARAHMDLGRERAAAGDHEGALEAYRAANEIMRVPPTKLAVGEALAALGRLIEARDVLLEVARSTAIPDEPKPFAVARERASKRAEEVGRRIPSIRVELSLPEHMQGEEATITVDGKSLDAATAKLPQRVDPGRHEVAAAVGGQTGLEQELDVTDGEHHAVRMVWVPSGDGAAAASDSGPSAFVWLGFGVAAAGAVVGSATGAAALAHSSALDADCPNSTCTPEQQDRIDTMDTFSTTSTIAFAVAGAGLAFGIAAWVFDIGGSAEAGSESALRRGERLDTFHF